MSLALIPIQFLAFSRAGKFIMSQVIISKSAIEKITNDPKFRQLREDKTDLKVPFLYYYRRSYSTLHDGTIVEHGDGFMLSFINRNELKETVDIVFKTVTLGEGLDILVGGPRLILSESFTIGWSNQKFIFEPQGSP
jgi:hypothetical protein